MQGYVYDIEADNLYIYSSKFGFYMQSLLTGLVNLPYFLMKWRNKMPKGNS